MYYYKDNPVDPDTGLATLPDGLYWHVFEDSSRYQGSKLFRLYIQEDVVEEKKNWLGKKSQKTTTKVYWKGYVYKGYTIGGFATHLTADSLAYSSDYELSRYKKRQADQLAAIEFESANEQFLGKYPPKSINREETN